MKIKNLSIAVKLVSFFLMVSLIPLLGFGLYSNYNLRNRLLEDRFHQLESIREMKKNQIDSFFVERQENVQVLADTIMVLQEAARERIDSITDLKKQAVEQVLSQYEGDIRSSERDELLLSRLNGILHNSTGLLSSGETYLVFKEEGRVIFGSDLTITGNGKYVYGFDLTDIVTDYIDEALSGKSKSDIYTDTRGTLVLVSYSPLSYGKGNWAIVTKIDLEEIITFELSRTGNDFFTQYIEEYGYYDLFLIHNQGHIFYSSAKESDYNTNILNGPYSDSNLAELVRKIERNRNIDMVDFSPYEPSNGDPAAFMGVPIILEGNLNYIAAVQISLEKINRIMNERTGMGETGETYLVGSDKLMRSDSYLEPETHSVVASFRNPAAGSVDTVASREALKGNSGSQVIVDYNGNRVLSSYVPLRFFGINWALISEIDEAEVLEPILEMQRIMYLIILVIALVIILLAFLIARSFTRPIGVALDFAQTVSEGDLTAEITLEQNDEIGKLIQALKEMQAKLQNSISNVKSSSDQVSSGSQQISDSSQQISSGATEQASSIEEISSSMEELAGNILQNTENAKKADKIAANAREEASIGGESVNDTVLAMRSIAEKIQVIEDIARNTNMLALNAAIEAARAGEAGKGFAVVASEVRKLAENSGKAAAEITEISVNSVEAAEKAGTIINELVPKIQETAELVQEITVASEEQSRGADQINIAIQQLDTVIQQNASASEELASMSEELNSQADLMMQSIAYFKLNETPKEKHPVPKKKMTYLPASPKSAVTEVPEQRVREKENEEEPDEEFIEF